MGVWDSVGGGSHFRTRGRVCHILERVLGPESRGKEVAQRAREQGQGGGAESQWARALGKGAFRTGVWATQVVDQAMGFWNREHLI